MSASVKYKCDECGRVFESTWSDEEALAESKEIFGAVPTGELAVVCDDCFKAMGFADEASS